MTDAMKPPPNITRLDYPRSKGWWVRFQIGNKSKVLSKLFSDGPHGGKRKALTAAKIWADEMRPTVAYRRPPRQSAGPGPGRIVERRYFYADRSGDIVAYRAVMAWILVAPGKLAATRWSIDKWGRAEARKRCEEWLARKRREQRRAFRAAQS